MTNADELGPVQIPRKRFLGILAGGFVLSPLYWTRSQQGLLVRTDLPLTPPQTEGPFYPIPSIEGQMFNDTDLTRKLPSDELADGDLTILDGVVTDPSGAPIEGTTVEIWQASSKGLYNHPEDSAEHPELDHDFQFWGRFVTGEDGAYSFYTITPGEYEARTARHIHFRVDAPSRRRLTTQSYFSQYAERNARDDLYGALTRDEQRLVTVDFDKPSDGPWRGSFHIVVDYAS